VRWDNLDYLVVDLPPGTGDVVLSLSQTAYIAGAIVVTSPQQVAVADTRRAVAMYEKLNIPVLGLVENMSYFVCRRAGTKATFSGAAAASGWPRNWHRIPRGDPDFGIAAPRRRHRHADHAGRRGVAHRRGRFVAAAERTAAQVVDPELQDAVIPLKPVN